MGWKVQAIFLRNESNVGFLNRNQAINIHNQNPQRFSANHENGKFTAQKKSNIDLAEMGFLIHAPIAFRVARAIRANVLQAGEVADASELSSIGEDKVFS